MRRLLRVLAWEFRDRSRMLLIMAMYLTLLFALQLNAWGLWLSIMTFSIVDDVLFCMTRTLVDPVVMVYRLVSPVVAVLTCVCFSHEYETKVLRSLMLKPVGKTTVFLAKLLYLVLASCLAFAAASAVYLALMSPRSLMSILSSSLLPIAILVVGAHYAAIFLLVISVATLFSIVLRNTALSAGLSLLIIYILDYVGSIAVSLRILPPWSIYQSFYENLFNIHFLISSPSVIFNLEPLKATSLSIMLLAFSWLMFTRVTEYG
ncbi:MAG: hypothetical protein QW385_05180 [Thermoproteota archaeon]